MSSLFGHKVPPEELLTEVVARIASNRFDALHSLHDDEVPIMWAPTPPTGGRLYVVEGGWPEERDHDYGVLRRLGNRLAQKVWHQVTAHAAAAGAVHAVATYPTFEPGDTPRTIVAKLWLK